MCILRSLWSQEAGYDGQNANVGLWANLLEWTAEVLKLPAGDHLGRLDGRIGAAAGLVNMLPKVGVPKAGEDSRQGHLEAGLTRTALLWSQRGEESRAKDGYVMTSVPTWKEDLLKPVLILVALRIYSAKVILIDLPFMSNVKLYLLKEKKTKYAHILYKD